MFLAAIDIAECKMLSNFGIAYFLDKSYPLNLNLLFPDLSVANEFNIPSPSTPTATPPALELSTTAPSAPTLRTQFKIFISFEITLRYVKTLIVLREEELNFDKSECDLSFCWMTKFFS